jgi:hypothetical protein
MPLQPIKLRPGINRSSTDYSNEGGYFACDKVRFRAGVPEKIGGWVKYTTTTVSGTCRNLFNWVTLDNTNILAIGTNTKLYIEASGGLYDITPIRASSTINSNPFSSTSGSDTMAVTDTAHGASVGDYVTFSGATAVGGWSTSDLNKEHQIVHVVDANTYRITMPHAATVTATGGGASVAAAYQISSTADVSVPGKGWNAGAWGRSTWNSTAPSSAVVYSTLRLWSIETFGEDLVFCTRDGQLYYWDFSDGLNSRATLLSAEAGADSVPVVATCLLMSTQERIMIAFGTNPIGSSVQDPLLVRWCDRENVVDWNPSASDTAGELRVSSGNYIVTAKKLKQEILIFTDASIHSMQFIGAPDIYGIQPVADNISIISSQAVAVVNSAAFWMGNDKFYFYNGRVDTLPCTLDDYIFNDINLKQADQIHCGTNERFSEIWWFYCSASSSTIDRYVIYNYDERTWAHGTMHRTAWLDSSLKESPVAASGGTLYYHEKGVDDDRTTAIHAWIESSDFNLGSGDQMMFVKRVLPDVSFVGSEASTPAVYMTLTPRNAPGAAYKTGDAGLVQRSAPLPVELFTERLDVRLRGRHMKLRVESVDVGVHWQLGVPRIEMQPDGGK